MKENIDSYLDSKKDAWSITTLKAERARLNTLAKLDALADPASCHEKLVAAGYAPYSIKQFMLRASQLEAFAWKSTLFEDYVKKHARSFRNSYTPKPVPITFEEAHEKILTIENIENREFALGLLASGLRISEPETVVDGMARGKGSKLRRVPNVGKVQTLSPGRSVSQFRNDLARATGLTPHQLRKLFATKAVQLGAREADLCKMMGWSSIATAASYVQATRTEEVTSKIGEMFK